MFDALGWIVTSPFICVGWIIVGAIAGAMARRIMGSTDKPFVQDLILGIAGAGIGGILLTFIDIGTPNGGIPLIIFNLLLATVTAAILIWIGRAIGGGNKKSAQQERRIP